MSAVPQTAGGAGPAAHRGLAWSKSPSGTAPRDSCTSTCGAGPVVSTPGPQAPRHAAGEAWRARCLIKSQEKFKAWAFCSLPVMNEPAPRSGGRANADDQ